MPFTLSSDDMSLGAVMRTRCKLHQPHKSYNLWTWLPAKPKQTEVGALVLGDSWADHVDMGFECWQTTLARHRGLSVLNAACGGERLGQCRRQLQDAEAACAELGLKAGADTLVILHAGGNDFLGALFLPPCLLALVFDMARLAIARASQRRLAAASLPYFSFVGLGLRYLEWRMQQLVATLHERGYRQVVVSGPPICAALPLARTVLTLLTLGLLGPGFVDATLRDLGALLVEGLRDEALPRIASRYDPAELQITFFDEAAAVSDLAAAAAEDKHGVVGTLRLLAACRRPTPHTQFWRDGHHATAVVHRELASRCEAALQAAPRPMRQLPASEAPHAPLLKS